jgi:hypothetical protein
MSKGFDLINPIYKVNHIINGSIDTIYIFNGKTKSVNEEELLETIFTHEESEKIKSENIKTVFCEQEIHFDDTIGTIKIKILMKLKKDISLDEIYLYSQKLETLNSVSVYQSLTQNKKIELTKIRFNQFISNIVSNENGSPFDKPEEKDIYTYDDILAMKLNNKKYIINKVLGQKFFIVENEYPFVCNPFDVKEYDSFFEKYSRKSLSTLNNHLLLNNGEIVNNNIFLCLAKDVLEYASNNDISEDTTIKIYYPFLYNKNIDSLDELEQSREKLIESNSKLINTKTSDIFKTVDLFYNVYSLKKTDLNYESKGIKYIKAIIKPNFDIKIPLEIIFKIVHATENNPLIKYNPSSKQENIYRLYTDKISTDGRKIPYLKKSSIFKLMKNIAKTKSVAIYIETIEGDKSQSLVCEFDENGFITISSEFQSIVNQSDIDNIFRNAINPIIDEIKVVLEQSGYKLQNFVSLNDENVEIKLLTYETKINITKPFNIESYKGCIYSIFTNETSIFKKDIHLRFKRVSNFSKVDSIEAFILEKSDQGHRGVEIIELLLENFSDDLNRAQAEDLVRKVANEIQVERGVRKTDIKIKDNPGFKTVISIDKKTGLLTITVENINNIHYLATIPIYLDTIIRLTQDKNSTNYPVKEINKLCSAGEKEDIIIPDIVSLSEESATKSEIPYIEDEKEGVEYADDKSLPANIEKPKGAFNLFFDEDEDEEGDYISEGGQIDSGSELSIPSEKDSEEAAVSSSIFGSDPSIPSEKSEEIEIPSPDVASDKSLESFGLSSEKSIPSEQDLSIPSSDKELSSIPSPVEEPVVSSSDKELSSIPSPVEEPVVSSSDKELSSIPSPEEEEEPVVSSSSDKELSSIPSPVEEPVVSSSDKELSAIPSPEEEEEPVVSSSSPEEEEEPVVSSSSLEEEEEEEEEEEDIRNIDGMKLNKPYYFQTLIEKKDPILILKEDTPQFNAYSRTCSSDTRRQPVILTDNQLTKINKEHPGFLREEDVIKYGSNPDNKFNYICPRYWCLKNNTIIDPKDLKQVKGKDGKIELVHPTCGKVIPRKGKDSKVVRPGYYIYEFYEKDDNKRYPGFQTDKHPDGYCLPCCFDKYNTEGRITAKKRCYGEDVEKKGKKEENDEYIKGPDKFPLDIGRWGYLPVEIQKILHEANADCQISKTNTNIRENHPCLLRHGIEINKNQSFVACISDVIFFGKKISGRDNSLMKILTVKEMREKIINAISIDTFIKYQNGNLVSDFYDENKKVDIKNYENTKLFTKLNMEKQEDNFYYKKVVSAYENFIDFLKDDNAIIDHTYLWDIISMPNKNLFPNGVNLVIFQIPNDDITNNVQILCPTNHYSNEFYEARKPTIFLIKEKDYYEPIYSYNTDNKKLTIIKEFKEYDPHLSKTIRAVFKEIIKPFFNIICRPLESMPNVYKAKRPLLLYNLIEKLDQYQYKILKLVVNFNNKVIGVLSQEPGTSNKKGFVPCYPSAIDDNLKKDLDFVFMTDLGLWSDYNDTVSFLNKLEKRSKKRRETADIPCKPAFKIIEDEHVVGILTETNQFVQLSNPIRENDIDEDLNIPSIKNGNYIVNPKNNPMIASDISITTENNVDEERVDYIKKIKLETSFYNVFRNTVRILINDYENVKLREKIEKEMNKEYIIYSLKLKNIEKLLKELIKEKIQFIGDENYYKLISEVSTCVVKNKEKCTATPNLCAFTENGDCNLILPEKNLITGKLNEEMYYGKMADELIRYNRIKSFILQPTTFLSFGNISYNLKDNEIIIIQSLLTQEYFETLNPSVTNKYVKHNSYDEVEPIITQTYENVIPSLDYAIGRKNQEICNKNIKETIISSIWKNIFPDDYREIEYSKNNFCTFTFMVDLIEKKTGNKLSINMLKNELYDEYKKYLEIYKDKIVDILIIEGKKTLGDQVYAETLSFSNFIYTDNYFLTPFDLWVLVQKYKIPTIFISQKFILQTKYEKHQFIAYGKDDKEKFAFIIVPGLRPENVPSYKLVQTSEGDAFISLDKLKEEFIEKIKDDIDNQISIEEYLENFTKPKLTKYKKKKPVRLIIESDSEELKVEPPEIKSANKKLIIEDISSSPEEFILEPLQEKKKQTRKKKNDVKSKKVSKKNLTLNL